MPSLRASAIELDPKRYRQINPQPVGGEPFRPNPAPEPPLVIRRSPVLISSLPRISTDVDGVSRQFYGGPNVPTRRLILPG